MADDVRDTQIAVAEVTTSPTLEARVTQIAVAFVVPIYRSIARTWLIG